MGLLLKIALNILFLLKYWPNSNGKFDQFHCLPMDPLQLWCYSYYISSNTNLNQLHQKEFRTTLHIIEIFLQLFLGFHIISSIVSSPKYFLNTRFFHKFIVAIGLQTSFVSRDLDTIKKNLIPQWKMALPPSLYLISSRELQTNPWILPR